MLFKSKTVVAHSGEFHADDVFAVASLSLLLGKVKVIRTRDQKIIEKGDYVVDVGGIHDPSKNRFDHHQSGGAGKRPNGIPYAAFGLVWKEYGEKIAGSQEVSNMIEQKLIQPMDALDNGVSISKEIFTGVFHYDIQTFIRTMNPAWNEDDSHIDQNFLIAVDFAKKLLVREIELMKGVVDGEGSVAEIYHKTEDKRLIILDQVYPWKGILSKFPEPLFVVHPKKQTWVLRTVRNSPGGFVNRKDLPASWAGKSGADLVAVTGVSDANFCHNMCFVAEAGSKEGALKLAKIALEA